MHLGKIIHVATDELGIHINTVGNLPRQLNGGLAEVHASHLRPEACPAYGVQPEVALQMEKPLPPHIAQGLQFHVVQTVLSSYESLQVVFL